MPTYEEVNAHLKYIGVLEKVMKQQEERLDAARAVIQRVWEHGCCCSDAEDYCKCDMVQAAKTWLEEE